ncbi:phosphodiester glycosidase family protein [Niabella beijingensis]|uniref:phosphodiester glycosidase family protein n=1 Tax=Niabella beijingensis TaxID=2872700 RepID=UPI001CBD7BD2|nr:phosphodiester glycosidase family protein [Niabella beijingensis]MBZ4189881.1 phosphodiester glycosidase family protein [Niabella beijingensis]
MRKTDFHYSYLLLPLFLFLTACSKKQELLKPYETYTAVAKTAVTKRLIEGTGLIANVFTDTTYKIVDGLQATEVRYLSAAGLSMKLFIFEVDLSDPGILIEASTPNNAPAFGRQPMTVQATYEDQEGHKVWGGINGDFFDGVSGTPRGILYKEGIAIRTLFPDIYTTFFGILKNRKAVVGDKQVYQEVEGDLQEAIGARAVLVKDGILVPQTDVTIEPRTSIGVSEDGNTVYFLVADGRNFYYSNGMNYETQGKFMKALGAYNAVNNDGGGSSTFFIRNTPAFTEGRFVLRNWPTDNGGQERAVANGLLIISKTQ